MNNDLTNTTEIINSNPEIKKLIESISSEYTLSMRKMTHEINNALTLINSSLQIIESSHPEVKSFKYWDSTIEDIHYLISLISEISFFNNSSKLSPEPTDLTEMLNNIINSFKAYKKDGDFDISINTLNNIPTILSDKTKLRQVLINIMKNAHEAFTPDNVAPYIHITLDYNNEYVSIAIEDNGCGISPEQMNTIFVPMVSYKTNGNGLGLPISKKIVEAHGGTISVDSVIDSGTKFIITLPV